MHLNFDVKCFEKYSFPYRTSQIPKNEVLLFFTPFLCCLGKHDEMAKGCNTSLQTITEQKDLIKQLEADLMNVRGYTSAYRGEGVGAPAPPSINTEFMTKAVQDIHTDEGIYTAVVCP